MEPWKFPPIDSEEVLQHAMAEQRRMIQDGEDRIREIVREEIRKAFAALAAEADSKESGMWYSSGYDDEQAACRMIRDVANTVVQEWTTPAPEPVNPFEPKYTAQEWADLIRAVIAEAEADGYPVWVDVEEYTGPVCIRIGTPTSSADLDPVIWEPKEAEK
jgi:acetyl-CoA carboxylase carboxyltransferase component